MEKLKNILLGAAVAGVLLGPAAWADDSLQVSARLGQAAAIIARTAGETSLSDQAVAAAHAVLPQLTAGARARN